MNAPPGGRRGNRRKPIAEINVVPYIDVTLVLLIIFMVTAPLLQSGVDVDLEKADGTAINPAADLPVIVTIKASGELFVNVDGKDDIAVGKQSLEKMVLDATKDKPKRQVLFSGDKSLEYGKVLTMMAALKKAGVPKVGLMTQPKE